jgi:two-component system, chemotaxis family, sensor histidine kinase and response regulator WspE
MMLELFRAEVESHSDALTSGLLKLEQDPTNVKGIDGLMRAAHSIKGAARIVQVGPAVEVAHVMEDCFVAAQRGLLTLQSDAIDVMLGSVDVLTAIAEESKNESMDWHSFEPTVQSIVLKLRAVLAGESIPMTAAAGGDLPVPAIVARPTPEAAPSAPAQPTPAAFPSIPKTIPAGQLYNQSVAPKLPPQVPAPKSQTERLELPANESPIFPRTTVNQSRSCWILQQPKIWIQSHSHFYMHFLKTGN